ncbi:MAG: hypothetical protein KDC83_12090 [Flavobacteriales bacterium]|nr:hypothetical protein [Flavobacteriales bacterium]
MRIVTFLLLTFFGQTLSCQILDNYQGKLYSGECIFNEDFIKQNNIKTIIGSISVKSEMQPIRSLGTLDMYTFNRSGKLIEHLNSFKLRGGRIDTTQDFYQYNDLEHLVSVMSYDLSGYDASSFEYDAEGNLKKEVFLRGENKSPYSKQIEKGKETVLKSETFEFELVNDSTKKKIYINSAGKPYKETVITYNRLDQKKSESTTFYLTNKKSMITYQYDVQGRLEKIHDFSNLLGNLTITYTYEYDEYGNLYSSKVYKDGKLTYSKEFIYHVQTFLLKAQLTKDEERNEIKIIQYEYGYY